MLIEKLTHSSRSRADKSDNGKLPYGEFEMYFGDGFLSEADLKLLYETIDADKSDYLDIDEVIECEPTSLTTEQRGNP